MWLRRQQTETEQYVQSVVFQVVNPSLVNVAAASGCSSVATAMSVASMVALSHRIGPLLPD
jgi:hypothetical protein